jgi:uncharacterized protein YkwD
MNLHLALYLAACAGLISQIRDVSLFRSEKQRTLAWTAASAATTKHEENSELVNRVHRQVNEFRREHDLKPLTLDPGISAEAREHSAEMAHSGNTISHRGFNQRLEDIRKKIPYSAAAENVAAVAGQADLARTAVEGWKNSVEHRKNMLGDFSLTGIGVAQSSNGTYFLTQIFIKAIK